MFPRNVGLYPNYTTIPLTFTTSLDPHIVHMFPLTFPWKGTRV
jgi:hypothetical protein